MAEYGRFFTGTRRIPMTFGTNPATGERIPGGPYTSTQFFGGLIVAVLMWLTNPLWGTDLAFLDLIIGAVAAAATTWLLRFAPDDLSDVFTVVVGASKIMNGSAHGEYEGKPLKPRKAPKIPAGLRVSTATATPQTLPVPELTESAESAAQAPRSQLGSSSVDRLLARDATPQESSR